MTPAEGKKRIAKLLGKAVAWRDNGKMSSPDARATARAQGLDAKAEYDRLKAERDARMKAILDADDEYQRLKAEASRAYYAQETYFGWARYYRISVGTKSAMFFSIKAEGDNWADVVAKLEKEVTK